VKAVLPKDSVEIPSNGLPDIFLGHCGIARRTFSKSERGEKKEMAGWSPDDLLMRGNGLARV